MMNTIISAIVASILSLTAPAAGSYSSADHHAAINEVQPSTLASGSIWKKDSYSVEGAFRFEHRDDGDFLVIEKDFSTKKGPDLKLVLSPLPYDTVTRKTALDGSLIVSPLRSFTGTQEYKLPAGTDLSRYKSLLVHCQDKVKLWAAAPIHDGQLLAHGQSWTKKSKTIKGSWEIARTDEGLVLRLGDDFKTSSMPDLILLLSPKPMAQVTNNNAADGGHRFATLSSAKGSSQYVIKGIDSLDGFRSLVIHCEEYTKCWGGADLN